MDIAQYLAELLVDHDEVGIPGLGTIYKEKIAAKFNSATGHFDPPAFRLTFRETIAQDTLLNDYISKTKNISLSSAEFFSGRFGEEIQQKLESDSKAELSSLGWLEKTGSEIRLNAPDRFIDSGNFGFKPVAEPDMSQFAASEPPEQPQTEPVQRKEEADTLGYNYQATNERDDQEQHPDEKEYTQTAPHPDEISTPLFDRIVLKEKTSWSGESVDTENEEATPAKRRKWVLLSVLFFLLIALSVAAYLFQAELIDVYKGIARDLSAKPAPEKPVARKPVAVPPPMTDSLPDSLADTVTIAPDTFAIKPVKKVAAAKEPASWAYIILETFTTMKEAQDYQTEMRAKSIETKIIDTSGGLIKVSTGNRYKDFVNADSDLKRIRISISKNAYPVVILN